MADALSRRLRSTLWAGGAVLLFGSVGVTCGIGVRQVEEARPVAGGPRVAEEVERTSTAVVPSALHAADAPDGSGHADARAAALTAGSAAQAPR